jgi:hypothetical protein
MNSADWWWEIHESVSQGATIVPLIGGSDKMKLKDPSNNKKARPIYLTLGNIHSSYRNKYSYLTHLVLAFRLVPRKFQQNSTFDD